MHLWLRRLYWDETDLTRGIFKETTDFKCYREGYAKARGRMLAKGAEGVVVVPKGPELGVEELREGERL